MGKNWAIAVGINRYNNLQPLRYAKQDAERVRQFFRDDVGFEQVYYFSDDSPPITQDYGPAIASQPTYATLRRFLRVRFERPFLKAGDNFWFFFAGHGIRYEDRDYLMPLDADPGDIDDTAIPLSYVAERLRRCGADNVVLLIDACRSRGRRDGLGIGNEPQQGVITIFSCSPKESSYEIEALGQGAFTHSLLQAMRIQGEGNCATVERLYQYLRYRVPLMNRQHNKPLQTPYAVVEPATKYHLILLPRLATVRDSEILKLDAFKAESARDLDLAEQLWIRVLMVSYGDPDAIEGIRRVDRLRMGAQGSASSHQSDDSGDRRPAAVQPQSPVPPPPSASPPKPKPSSDRRPTPPAQVPATSAAIPIFSPTPTSSSTTAHRPSPPRPPVTRSPSSRAQPSQRPSLPISRRRLLQISGGLGAGVGAIALGRLLQGNSEAPTSNTGSETQPADTTDVSEASSIPGFEPETKTDTSVEFSVVTVTNTGDVANVERKSAPYRIENLGNGLGLEMMSIAAGTFTMGSPPDEENRDDGEGPQHEVSVPAFEMGKYAITQAQWRAIAALPKVNRDLDADPSGFEGNSRPVERVSWNDAVEFCDRLSQLTGREYRLPSEAEWEYACRAGTTTPFHFGETITPDLANYDGNYTYGSGPEGIYREETTNVGSFPPNAFGLYDMHGNVWEWCLDHWHDSYEGAPTDGSAWTEGGDSSRRLLRGGSWSYTPRSCRSANRDRSNAGSRYNYIGFRVVCSAPRTS